VLSDCGGNNAENTFSAWRIAGQIFAWAVAAHQNYRAQEAFGVVARSRSMRDVRDRIGISRLQNVLSVSPGGDGRTLMRLISISIEHCVRGALA